MSTDNPLTARMHLDCAAALARLLADDDVQSALARFDQSTLQSDRTTRQSVHFLLSNELDRAEKALGTADL